MKEGRNEDSGEIKDTRREGPAGREWRIGKHKETEVMEENI